jgi:hypothetical protein
VSEFPPTPRRPAEINAALKTFATVTDSGSALYVSSPLTTGQRAFEWHQRNGSTADDSAAQAGFRENVIASNRDQAGRYVEALRAKQMGIVIDPTALEDVAGWTQSDYRFFWGRVIEEYAATVVFRDGWEYSSGCAYEFLVAARAGLTLLCEDLTPLSIEDGRKLLAAAIAYRQGIDLGFLQGVNEMLEAVSRGGV